MIFFENKINERVTNFLAILYINEECIRLENKNEKENADFAFPARRNDQAVGNIDSE